jgi:putative FmdB family regulatory protein
MPIYEYTCQKCKAHIEALQKMTDKPLTRCRKCGGKLEKEWSRTSFQLKGAGWYVTDYASQKVDPKVDPKEATSGETKATGGETKDAAQTEAKAETKSEVKNENTTAVPDSSKKSKKAPATAAPKSGD